MGWPAAAQLEAIVGKGQWLITVWPGKARKADSIYRPEMGYIAMPAPCPMVATTSILSNATTVTLSGTNAPGISLHTIVGPYPHALDTLYQTTGTETLAQVATDIAALVNGLAFSGIVATATGNAVAVTGSSPVRCNVGQTDVSPTGLPIYVQEVNRFQRDVQITVWAPTPDVSGTINANPRETLDKVVIDALGGYDQPWLYAPDGSAFEAVWLSPGEWSDKPEQSYAVFRSDNILSIEYPHLKPVASTPIGVIKLLEQIGSSDALLQVIGGP